MSYIFFPSKLGQLKNGVEKTPSIFKMLINKNNKKSFIKSHSSKKYFYDTVCGNNLSTNLISLYKLNSKIKGRKINIGGDHSMSLATVASSLNKFNNLKVIWIDAHADLNTSFSSTTDNIHGMPLGYLTGLDYSNKFLFINNLLKFENLLYIGIRDLDPFEQKIINLCNIQSISSNEINTDTDGSLKKINNFIGNNPYHLSFDVDSLDPSIIPSTGTPVKNGLQFYPTKNILINLIHNPKMVNMDITELNLSLGSNKDKAKTLRNIEKLFF